MSVWILWFFAAVALIVGELFTATFFLLCPGLGALAAAAAAAAGGGQLVQWSVFTGVTVLAAYGALHFAKRCLGQEPSRRANVDRFINMEARVSEPIDPVQGSGRVLVEHEEWRAESADNRPIEVNATVSVIGVRGTHLLVKEIS